MQKTIVITGATSGIGYALTKELAFKGERVLAIGRNQEKCDIAMQKIKKDKKNLDLVYLPADFSSLSEIKELCVSINKLTENKGIDCLINNASTVPKWYMTTKQGYEMQFQVNHLAGVLLAHELMVNLIKAKGVIITTSSKSHRGTKMNFKDLMFSSKYSLLRAYKQSKLANVLFTYQFNRIYMNKYGTTAYAVDPGLVNTDIGEKNTSGIVKYFWKLRKKFGKNPEDITDTYLELIYKKSLNSADGYYYKNKKAIKPSLYAQDEQQANRLWQTSYKLIGEKEHE